MKLYQFKSAYDEERQHHSQDDSEGSPPLEERRPDLFAPEAAEMTALSIGKLVTDAALMATPIGRAALAKRR